MVSIAQLPKDSQNITLIAASYINGVLKAMLSRYTKAKPVQANRPYDLTTGTYYMLYPFSGGAVLNGLPQYHELMPDVTPVPYSFAGAGC